jgi:hypothetical protein
MDKKRAALIGSIIFILILDICIAPPPEDRTVKGTVFKSDSITQVESGVNVIINNTNNHQSVSTKTYGPPNNRGIYSATINASPSNIINVIAFNDTHWGESYGVMGQTQVTIDVLLNRTRDPEFRVSIILPQNNTNFNSTDFLNLTVNLTLFGNSGINCNATLTFSVLDVFTLAADETYAHNLGNLARGASVIEV